jgi:anti-sigma factor RsiW
MADHLQSCLACQAELAGYRRLLRVLRSLRDEPVLFASHELIGETLTALSERMVDRTKRPAERWLVAGALVAAAAVGVGALLARSGVARSGRSSGAVAASL